MTLSPHPLSSGFAWVDHERSPTTLTPADVAQFDRDGFVLVKAALDPVEVDRVRVILDGIEAEVDEFLGTQDEGRVFIAETGAITFAPNLAGRSEELAAFTRDPTLLGICRDLVGPDVNLYWDQAVYKKPEKPRRFPWHQDNGYTFVEPQAYLTCWIPITAATRDNGCPVVAPGVHRHGTLAHTYIEPLGWECFETPPVDPVLVEADVGDIIVFSSLTPHLTGPNTTSDVRKAYIVQYAPEGATALRVEGDKVRRVPMNDPAIQYPVLRAGDPVVG